MLNPDKAWHSFGAKIRSLSTIVLGRWGGFLPGMRLVCEARALLESKIRGRGPVTNARPTPMPPSCRSVEDPIRNAQKSNEDGWNNPWGKLRDQRQEDPDRQPWVCTEVTGVNRNAGYFPSSFERPSRWRRLFSRPVRAVQKSLTGGPPGSCGLGGLHLDLFCVGRL